MGFPGRGLGPRISRRGISPLQGLVIILRNIPRAMPWAFTWRPVGAWVIALRVNLENVPSVWRTSRPKGRGRATNHAFLVPTGRGHATNHAFLVPTGRGHATNHAFLVPTGRGRATNHALPAPTGRPVKAQGIALVWAVKQWQALVGKLTYLRSRFVSVARG